MLTRPLDEWANLKRGQINTTEAAIHHHVPYYSIAIVLQSSVLPDYSHLEDGRRTVSFLPEPIDNMI